MTVNDYLRQFRKNMTIMSRTANGEMDLSASATKADSMAIGSIENARNIAFGNVDRAVSFLFDNRGRKFGSEKELEELLLETAEITNKGIIKEGSLFRSGEDSTKFKYARIKDLPAIWDWFVGRFYHMLASQCFEAEEIAAFSEYVINIMAHFFSDGCGRISMLISMYVFMRYDLPCPGYTSRDEYLQIAIRGEIPTMSDLYQLFEDPEYRDFVSYYRQISARA